MAKNTANTALIPTARLKLKPNSAKTHSLLKTAVRILKIAAVPTNCAKSKEIFPKSAKPLSVCPNRLVAEVTE